MWGNTYRRIAGWINNKGNQVIKLTYGQSDGSTVDGYNTDGTGYISTNCTPAGTSGGYIKKMTFTKYGLIPTVASGSATTYYTDALRFDNSIIGYPAVGGFSGNGTMVGSFYVYLAKTASGVDFAFTASPSCKPLAPIEEVE